MGVSPIFAFVIPPNLYWHCICISICNPPKFVPLFIWYLKKTIWCFRFSRSHYESVHWTFGEKKLSLILITIDDQADLLYRNVSQHCCPKFRFHDALLFYTDLPKISHCYVPLCPKVGVVERKKNRDKVFGSLVPSTGRFSNWSESPTARRKYKTFRIPFANPTEWFDRGLSE